MDYSSDKKVQAHLFGLAVGVNDYSKTKGVTADNLSCCMQDAEEVRKVWLKQRGTELYHEDAVFTQLLDGQATHDNILHAIASLAKKVEPDDWVVIFLAGHGMADKAGRSGGQDVYKPNTWVFICPDFNSKEREKTGLTGQALHQRSAT